MAWGLLPPAAMLMGLVLLATLVGLTERVSAAGYDPVGVYDVEHFKLENGLDVILKRRTHAPNVAVRLVVNAGFRHFPCDKRETPHFLEHLLFMGTSKHSEAELKRLIEDHGGQLKGSTRSTVTDYQVDIYDRHLPVAINALYEMMTDSVITPQKIESAREVIYREHKGEYPWLAQWLYEKGLFKGARIKVWEFLLPTVQCPSAITPDAITQADVMEAYSNYYVPANMTLVVVGNFDRAKLVPQIKSTFGRLPAKASNGRELISPPYMNGQKEATGILWPLVGSDGVLAIAYRTDGRSSPDFYALSLLEKYFKRVVLERVRIKEAISYKPGALYHAEDDFGIFVVAADVSLDKMERAKVLLEGGVEWVKQGWISTEQLEAIKQGMIWDLAIRYDSNSSMADYYVSSLPQLKTDGALISLEGAVKNLTPEDLRQVAFQYFQNDSRAIAREAPTLTFTQFFVGLGFLMLAVPGTGFYLLRRFLKRRRSRITENQDGPGSEQGANDY